MNSKQTAIVAVVIVAIVLIAGTLVVLKNDDKKDDNTFDTTSRLLVYGNANNDNYLDKQDIELVEKIIAEDIPWSKTYPYADANHDGFVNQKDVDTIKSFINGESGTMYYTDWNGNASSVPYPLTGKIAALYDSTIWICQILGVSDDISLMFRTDSWLQALSADMFPEKSNIKAYGGYDNIEAESVAASDVSIILGDPWAYTDTLISELEGYPGKDMTVVKLPENREVNGLNWSNSVVSLGVMMNKQDKTKEYIEYIENVESKINSKIQDFSESEKNMTFIIVYVEPGMTDTYVDIYGTGSTQFGDICTIDNLPFSCAMGSVGPSGYVQTTVEEIIALDADVIFLSTWGPFSNGYTEEQYKALVSEEAEKFKTTNAYKNGNIYSFSYEIYGTLPGISGLVYLASQIWPDHFSETEGLEYLQEYIDKFTKLSGTNVKDIPTILPLTLKDMKS